MPSEPDSQTWTVRRLLEWTAPFFARKDVDSPRLSAELLLSHVLNVPRIKLYTDYDRPLAAKDLSAFRELVQIALAADKPIIIHTRKREARALELLEELGAARVNWHCFGGRVKLARRIAEHGHYMSIPANARRSETFTRMLQTLPRQQILLETDCPYLAAEPGTPSEPAHVAATARYAAEIWGLSLEATLGQLAENFERLFGVPP